MESKDVLSLVGGILSEGRMHILLNGIKSLLSG